MADFDHNLSLADALTEPQPQIEEEVKRDFIATLEAEKFDDMVGETVGKTDYVPLLDDDDPKPGNQDVKTKPHADNVPAERTSATGPAAVVENGDHGIEGTRKVSPGKIMDEKMSYKEFLDRNDSWTMDDRAHCFEPQPAFKPMDVTEPFKMHREDVLSDLLLLPQEMTNVPPFGEYFGASQEVHAPYGVAGVPEQPLLGPQHPPANIFDPMAFLDSGAESLLNQNEAAPAGETGLPEDFWLRPQHLAEGQGTPFFEPPAPSKTLTTFPGCSDTGLVDVTEPNPPESKQSAPAASPAVGGPGPAPAVEELMGFEPSFDQKSLPLKESMAGSPEAEVTKEQKAKAADTTAPGTGGFPVLGKQEESWPSPIQHKEKEETSQSPSQKAEELARKTPPSQKVDDSQPFFSQWGEEKEATAATKPPAQKMEEAKPPLILPTEEKERPPPSPKVEEPKAPPAQHTEKVAEGQHAQEGASKAAPAPKAEEPNASPSQHLEKKAEESKISPNQPAASQEGAKTPSSPLQPWETFTALEKLGEKDKQPPSKPTEKLEENKQPLSVPPVAPLPEPAAESKEPVRPGESKADAKEPLAAVVEVAKPKEAPEPRPDHPAELPQGKASLDPAVIPPVLEQPSYIPGALPAQGRHANKPSDHHRRVGRAKPAWLPAADSPEELLVGLPASPRSHNQGGDPFSVTECSGFVAGTSPRSRAPYRKAAGQAFEFTEGARESWDLEASTALKKKKKKQKQKRVQQPRGAEMWEESSERPQAPLCAPEPQKPEVPFTEPKRSVKEVSRAPVEVTRKDPSVLEREGQILDSLAPVSVKGELALQAANVLDATSGRFGQVEEMRDGSLKSPSKSREPLEEQLKRHVQKNQPGSPTWPQASPVEMTPFGTSRKSEESSTHKDSVPIVPTLEAKPAVSKEAEVLLMKPAAAGEKVTPDGPAPLQEVLVEEPKKEEKGRKGRSPGGGAAKSPTKAKAMEPAMETSSPDKSKEKFPVAPESSPPRECSPGNAQGNSPAKSATLDFGSAETPFFLESKSDLGKPFAPAKTPGSAQAPSTEMGKGASSGTPEQPTGAQAKKRGSDGRSKRVKNPPAPRLSLLEDQADGGKAPGAEEAVTPPESSMAARSPEAAGFSSSADSKAAPASAVLQDKPKRSSEGKSRKAMKRSSMGASFPPAAESGTGPSPAEASRADQSKENNDSSKGADLLAASQLREASAADTTELQAPAATSLMEKIQGPPTGRSEWVDFPSSAYPFILETPAKAGPPEANGATVLGESKGPSFAVLESPTSALPGSKPKKRNSDGRSRKSGKTPPEQPFLPEAASDLSKTSEKADGTPKESGTAGRGVTPPLEQPENSEAQVAAAKPVGKSERKEEGSLDTAPKKSGFEQLIASDPKTSTAKQELFAKDTEKGQEASLEPRDRTELPKFPHPFTEPAAEEARKGDVGGQSHQVCVQSLEAKSEPARLAAEHGEVAKMEEAPSPSKIKEKDRPLKEARDAGQGPDVGRTSRGSEAKNRKEKLSLECPFLWGEAKGEAGALLGDQREDEQKEPPSPRSSKEGSGGGSAVASKPDPAAKAAKRGNDRKSKKAASGPDQPTLHAKVDPTNHEQHPKLAGFLQGVEEMEFVDENRNIKSLPPGHQIHWEENRMSLFGPFAPPSAGGLDEAPSKSPGLGCPFLEDPGKFMSELSKEQLFLSEMLKDASKSDREAQHEPKENVAKLGGHEAVIEASLLLKAGDETREKRKKSKRPHAKQELTAGKDKAFSSVLDEDGKETLVEKTQGSGPGPSELPAKEVPKETALLVAGTEGNGSVGKETSTPSGELPPLWENKREAAVLQALTTALVGGTEEPDEKGKGAEPKTSERPDSLGSKAGADKVPEDVHGEETASAPKPKDPFKPLKLDDVKEPEINLPAQAASKEEEAHLPSRAAEPKGTQSSGSEAGELIPQAVAGGGDQGARETKKEERRARAAEQMKGYMRPTKSRGLPLPPPPSRVAAVQEQGRRRLAKADGPNLQRQEKAKPEEIKPAAEVVAANDIAAPPSKELPPSPEKKAKPSASTSATKPAAAAAAKTKAAPTAAAAAAPAKRPASTAMPGQNKKATSPTAATTPKRLATSTARPSSLTPKEPKPKGTDAKSPDKRTSPLKPPSATTPRPAAKSSPATPRPSTALASTNAPSPRSTATSPPKRPSTIKTDAKPADAKKTVAKSPSADLSRPKSAPASTAAKSSATTPTAAAPGLPGAAASRPKPATPRLSGTGSSAAEPKKASTLKAAPKTSPIAKPPRPPTSSVSAPDLKNVRSKIGSTDNIKHQPGGGRAKVERKAESAGAARKPELNAVSKTAPTKTAVSKEGAPKQPNGKVQIVSKKANYSHVQSKCGSKDNIKHVPGGGNVPNTQRPSSGVHSQSATAPRPSQGSTHVQILSKKIDLSKVSSKCGSKANIKHKPGGGDVKIENQKLNFKEKAQAKVGSLDNVGHIPAGGTVKTEGGEEAAPQNGAVTAPPPGGSPPTQENGVGLPTPAQGGGGGDQREIQCFDTHIQETN
ncbi:microtubule-associated protein futsch-like [Lacerta agilis]|uniref:microtubule-associated protein futsch-like n=1 Tax=Lacerta agilis TaxID=80427 RepID=UPI00141A2DA0|nr:microtubule-associated protein futsch-like [Lacerta agilis]